MSLTTKKLGPNWWILGYGDYGPMGPYKTKADADEIKRGVERTLRYMDEPGFITSDPPREIVH